MRKLVGVALAVLCVVAVTACGRGSDTEPVITLDGSPRYPDDEGVVTEVSRERITLDGKRTYQVSENLRSFSALDLSIVPLLHHEDRYVQVGLDDDTVVWIGRIAEVVRTDVDRVYYVGHLVKTEGKRLVMRDGTVLTLASEVDPPAGSGPVQALIDPARHAVVQITLR